MKNFLHDSIKKLYKILYEYIKKDELKPYKDKIKKYLNDKSSKINTQPKKENLSFLKIFTTIFSFFIALVSFPLIFIFGPFWVVIYFSLATSIIYAFFSKDLED